MSGGGGSTSILHGLSIVDRALLNIGPRDRGGVHVGVPARLTLRRISLSSLHAQNEGPGSVRGVTRGNRVNAARQQVLSTHFVHIRSALISAVLAGEAAVSVLLGVTVGDL